MSDSQHRNLNIDLIRILATTLILTAHITALIFARPDFFGKPFWWLNHLVLSFCRVATPLFFMMSGFLIGDKKKTPTANIQRAISRLGVPFLVFFALSSVIFGLIHSTPFFPLFMTNMFLGGGNYLYFLVGLFILYLLNPFLQKMTAALTQSEFKTLILFLCANTGLYSFGAYLLSEKAEMSNPTFLYWFLTLGFFLYGAYLKKYPVSQLKTNDFVLGFSPILLNIIGTYLAHRIFLQTDSLIYLKIANYLQSYLGITVIISSLHLFKVLVTVHNFEKYLKKYAGIISFVSKNTFGVYLFHMIFLEYFLFRTPLTIDNGPFNPAIMLMLIWVALMLLSLGASVLVGKIPILKKAVGVA